MVRLSVDGRAVDVAPGASLLEAARAAGVAVPTLCHDDRLAPAGGCRVCLVRADEETVAACLTPVRDGLWVDTEDPVVHDRVRLALELAVERLPLTALGPDTELSRLCRRLGVGEAAFSAEGRGLGRDESHPYLLLDRDLCIACGRCVQLCEEVQGTFALTLTGRGSDTVVAPGDGPWSDSACVGCGGCVTTCPTGALRDRVGSTGPATAVTTTTCGYCGVGCTLDVHTTGDRIVAVTPTPDGPVNQGHACVKGRYAHGFVTSPDRLTSPLLRRGDRLEPVTWDEALRHVASTLTRVRSAHGPDAIAAISSARCTNEENYLVQKLVRAVIGTNNVDNCSRICHAPSAAGLTASFGLAGGTNPAEDLDRADLVMVVGSNTTEAHPVVGARIKRRVLQGARLVVVDPRRTELARLADVHLRGRPGSNVAVFNGIAHLLLAEGWADLDFLAARANGLDALRATVAAYDPVRVEELSGVPSAALRAAARAYGEAAHPTIVYGLGVTEHAHGTDGVRTLANLAVLRGAVGTPTGGGILPLRGQNNVQGASDMGALPDLLPGYQPVVDAGVRARFEAAWGTALPSRPGLRIPEMFNACLDGRVRALYVVGEDVAQTDPDSGHVRAALAACELLVCQDAFLSETARLADVVLPAATFLEKDGTFVNFDRRFQRVRPAVAPPAGARSDFDILTAVARALGADLGCPSPADALAECASLAPLFGGISHARLDRDGPLHWPCRTADDPGEARLHQQRFATPSGRAELAAREWLPPGEEPDAAYPYTLVTGRRLAHYNSGSMTRRTPNLQLAPTDSLDVSPVDAAALGVSSGDTVEVTSRRGGLLVRARVTDDMSPGELFLDFHFPDVPANLLTSGHTDDTSSCPEYKVTAVRVRVPRPGRR